MKAGFDRIGRTVSLQDAARSCLDKQRFSSRTEARDRAAIYGKAHPDWKPQKPYRCTLCGGWHLTTNLPAPGGTILKKRPTR